jgi:hypothetical protein
MTLKTLTLATLMAGSLAMAATPATADIVNCKVEDGYLFGQYHQRALPGIGDVNLTADLKAGEITSGFLQDAPADSVVSKTRDSQSREFSAVYKTFFGHWLFSYSEMSEPPRFMLAVSAGATYRGTCEGDVRW